VGKSYLMYEIVDVITKENPESEIIYINKELDEFSAIHNYKDLLNYVRTNKSGKHKTNLFIDEIQEIVEFEKALRS
jgi:uncharacterized protein